LNGRYEDWEEEMRREGIDGMRRRKGMRMRSGGKRKE
jgi:hypothetical protein